MGEPFTEEKLNYIWDKEKYESIVCYVDCFFKDNHGWVHVLVAGHMEGIACSPSNPVFFIHHGFIDFIWEEFRQNSQVTDPELEYPYHVVSETNIGSQSHDPDALMQPFDFLFNIHGLSDHYVNYYYAYAPRPISCEEESDCQSAILWCDVTEEEGRCKAKVMEGGNCVGLPDQACACPSKVATLSVWMTSPDVTCRLQCLLSLSTWKDTEKKPQQQQRNVLLCKCILYGNDA